MAALVLAHGRPGLTIVEPGSEAEALATVPIGILDRVAGMASADLAAVRSEAAAREAAAVAITAFEQWGLKTLGELAALPAADLTSRLGRQALVWQAIARGDDLRPLVPALEEERFEASLDLEWPIDGLEPLSFVLTRLLEPLSTRLERRDRGTAVLHVILRLVTREPHVRRLELPSPMRDVRTLRTLALLDLESHPPGAAIDRVTIVIDPTPGRILQHTLFTRAQPTPEQLSTLIARLGALMGQDRLGAPAVVDSYRPGAFAMVPFATDHDGRRRVREAREHDDQRRTRRTRRNDDQQHSAGSAGSASNVVNSADSAVNVVDLDSVNDVADSVVSTLRRCRQPVPARVAVAGGRPVRVTTDRRGFAGGSVVACAGPWRSSGNWWIERADGAGGERLRPHGAEDLGILGSVSASVRAGGGAPAPVQERLRPHGAEDLGILGSVSASVRVGGGAPAPVQERRAGQAGGPVLPLWDCDEWDVALNDGAVYRVFQDRGSGAWFIDAIVD